MKKLLTSMIYILIAGFLVIQLVPYGRDHSNPPVVQEPKWDSARTRRLAQTACFDCHSNETNWPWYTHIAPASWRVWDDVQEARQRLNFSDWGSGEADPYDAIDSIQEDEMPPALYLLARSQARLSQVEKDELVAGLKTTIKNH